MIIFISSSDGTAGAADMAREIASALQAGKKVLWLVPGGSNIPLSVMALADIRRAAHDKLAALAIMLSDERFGPVGHADSNWRQLEDAGFDSTDVRALPTLVGAPLAETVAGFSARFAEEAARADLVIGQFGMGADGHIAGILPGSPGIVGADGESSAPLACSYEAAKFTRVTLTFAGLRKIQSGYAFVFGASKSSAVVDLRSRELPFAEQPAQFLKRLPRCAFYTDITDIAG